MRKRADLEASIVKESRHIRTVQRILEIIESLELLIYAIL